MWQRLHGRLLTNERRSKMKKNKINKWVVAITAVVLACLVLVGILVIPPNSNKQATKEAEQSLAPGQTITGSNPNVPSNTSYGTQNSSTLKSGGLSGIGNTSQSKKEKNSKNNANTNNYVSISPKDTKTIMTGKTNQVQTQLPDSPSQNQTNSFSDKTVTAIEKQVDSNPTYLKKLSSDPRNVEVQPLKLEDYSYMVSNNQVLITTTKDGTKTFTPLSSPSDWALLKLNSTLNSTDYLTLVKYFNTVNDYLVKYQISLVQTN